MGKTIYSFLITDRESTAAITCSSYSRDWILAKAQRIADNFDVDIEVVISLPDCEKPLAKMCIYPRKAGGMK